MAKSKSKEPASTKGFKFAVPVADFLALLKRIHTLVKGEGIDASDLNAIFEVTKDKKLWVRCGAHGTFIEDCIEVKQATQPGLFTTNLMIPYSIRYGGKTVTFEPSKDGNTIRYSSDSKSKHHGSFPTASSVETVMGSRSEPKAKKGKSLPPWVEIGAKALLRVIDGVYFNADVIDDHTGGDVMVRLSVEELAVSTSDDGIKRKSKKKTKLGHRLMAQIFDRHRASVCAEPCYSPGGVVAPMTCPVTYLSNFVNEFADNEHESLVRILFHDGALYMQTGNAYAVSPASQVQAKDVMEIHDQLFPKGKSRFMFEAPNSDALETIKEALSIRAGIESKITPSKAATEARLKVSVKGKVATLSVHSGIGQNSCTLNLSDSDKAGSVELDGSYVVECCALVRDENIKFEVWPKAVRVVDRRRHHLIHIFSTMQDHAG